MAKKLLFNVSKEPHVHSVLFLVFSLLPQLNLDCKLKILVKILANSKSCMLFCELSTGSLKIFSSLYSSLPFICVCSCYLCSIICPICPSICTTGIGITARKQHGHTLQSNLIYSKLSPLEFNRILVA